MLNPTILGWKQKNCKVTLEIFLRWWKWCIRIESGHLITVCPHRIYNPIALTATLRLASRKAMLYLYTFFTSKKSLTNSLVWLNFYLCLILLSGWLSTQHSPYITWNYSVHSTHMGLVPWQLEYQNSQMLTSLYKMMYFHIIQAAILYGVINSWWL